VEHVKVSKTVGGGLDVGNIAQGAYGSSNFWLFKI